MGRLVGYVRVSTEDQTTQPQRDVLEAAGCQLIFEDIASGAKADRVALRRCLKSLNEGDTLMVARLDRLGRSAQHLLEIVNGLRKRGVFFRSVHESFETASAQGQMMMTMLGAFAEFERNIISERTKAGITAARSRGAILGNPQLRAKDPTAIALMKATQADRFLERDRQYLGPYVDYIRNKRPFITWEALSADLANPKIQKKPISVTVETLKRKVARLVKAGDLPPEVMQPKPRKGYGRRAQALIVLEVLRREYPEASLSKLGRLLEEHGVRPIRAAQWSRQGIRQLLEALND